MNSTQSAVAETIGNHFNRQWMQMARSGPVNRIREDQETTVSEFVSTFKQQSPGFDEAAFRKRIAELSE